jgi:hypothetical protein
MKSKREFLVSRAVEEPLEATLKLGDNIQIIARKTILPMRLGFVAFILIILLLIPSIYDIISYIWQGFTGGEAFTTKLMLNTIISIVIIIILFAMIITTFLYLTQIANFIARNLLRCCKVSDLTEAKIAEKKTVEKSKINGKHFKNPIFAVMDLEEESMHVLPQIVKMLRFCVFFITITLVILIFTIVMNLGFDYNLLFSMDLVRMGVSFVVVGELIIILFMFMKTETEFRYIHTRHQIIDSVRFSKDIRVPKGKTVLQRLIVYLKENDPYIGSLAKAEKKEFSEGVKLAGSSGKEHFFDAYLTGDNILKDKSVALGMPMGGFAVFIRIFKDEITLSKIKELKDSAVDVCQIQGMFPLRIIALQWSIGDLPDDVYEYVLENPITTKNTLTNLEIMAEDGEIYSFIPMISYGEKLV